MNTDPLLTDAEGRTTNSHSANMKFDKLKEFRQAAYKHLGKAHDATFELTDAILTTRNAYSLADLSLSPFLRRKWPSIYEALQDSRPKRQKLMQLYIKQIPIVGRLLLAGDHTLWPRPDAVTPGRVAQAMGIILEGIGTPACSPKSRGKSPGWKPGEPRQRRIRYPIVQKRTTKPRKQQAKSA